jgi:serine/threonine-protein kinase RsbW
MSDELIISSRTEDLQIIREFIEKRLTPLPFTEKEKANIVFCLIEAAINAMNHGNMNDPEKPVKITFDTFPDKITLTVSDQGCGFDPDSIGDPREPTRLKRPSGRGIFFMRQMLSNVDFKFSDSCTTVVLEKYFNGLKK